MADLQSMPEAEIAVPALAGTRLGLAALRRVLEDHRAWLQQNPDGARARLQGVVLSEADLEEVNLERADLRSANFTDARMSGANLSGAVMQFAD